jgi:hypothetical protein
VTHYLERSNGSIKGKRLCGLDNFKGVKGAKQEHLKSIKKNPIKIDTTSQNSLRKPL